MDAVFKALADPSRRALLDQLHAENGQTLNQLCGHLQMTRQGITKHLGLLVKAELVVRTIQSEPYHQFVDDLALEFLRVGPLNEPQPVGAARCDLVSDLIRSWIQGPAAIV